TPSARSRGKARRPPRRHDRVRARAAPGGACADSVLPTHAVGPDRPAVPLPAELLGLYRRGDRPSRRLGRGVDGRCAHLSLPSLGRLGIRSAASGDSCRRVLDAAVALRSLALPLRLTALPPAPPAYMDGRHSESLRDHSAWLNRAARRPHPRPASKEGDSSLSKRGFTTRSAPTCLRAQSAPSKRRGRRMISSASPARSKFRRA